MSSLDEFARSHGLGHPDGPVWFLGLEEAAWNSGSPAFTPRPDAELISELPQRVSSVWKILAYVMAAVGQEESDNLKEAAKCFLNEKLFRQAAQGNERCFFISFRPMPKMQGDEWGAPLASVEKKYGGLLGRRVAFLRQLRQKHQPKVVVCPASVRSIESRWLFDLLQEPDFADQHFQVFKKEGVILSPFFTARGGMFNREKIQRLAGFIKDFL